MLCDGCQEHQQFLLDNGDGSQVICDHLIIDDNNGIESTSTTKEMVTAAAAAAAEATGDSDESTPAIAIAPIAVGGGSGGAMTSADRSLRKRKFPTLKQFAEVGGDKMKRKIAPIQKWSSLSIKKLFLVKKVIRMEVVIKKQVKEGFYAELENEEGLMVNVWITDIIRKELEMYPLEEGNTYIMPLGLEQSRDSGYMYNNFVVQVIKDVL